MSWKLVMALTAVAATLHSGISLAQEVALPDTEVRHLRAHSNGIEYKLYVSVPRGYATSTAKFPVLYLLDADYAFPVTRAIVQHLSDRKRLPQILIVGIAYGGPRPLPTEPHA